MKTISLTLVLCCLAIISMAFINAKPAFAITYCQTVSLTSSSCPNPPGGGVSYPLVLPRDVTVIGYEPDAGGGFGGFFSGGPAGGQVTGNITSVQVAEAAAASEGTNIAIMVIWNGSTVSALDVSFTVLVYQPLSGTWFEAIGINNSSLTLSDVKTIINNLDPSLSGTDFIQKLLDIIKSSNASINIGGGAGPGSNPDGSNLAAYIEIDGATVCYGYSGIQPSTGNSFTLSPDATTINLGAVVVNGTCP